jgi:hypothetical protein
MQPDCLFQAGFFAVVQFLLTGTIIVISRRAANGQLKRNQTTGIRTPSTMRSDQAWVAGHRAALRLTPLYLLQLAVGLALLVVAVLHARTRTGIVVAGIGGMLLFLPVVIVAALVAGRAAKAADNKPDTAQRQAPKIGGSKAIYVYAVFNGLLLAAICVGLWLLAAQANSNRIPPNRALGFRDGQTLASEHGWYAAQRVGFHIGAVAATIITVAVLAVLVVAYLRRLHPAWALIAPIIGGVAVAVAMVVAGQYADDAARAATSAAAPLALP